MSGTAGGWARGVWVGVVGEFEGIRIEDRGLRRLELLIELGFVANSRRMMGLEKRWDGCTEVCDGRGPRVSWCKWDVGERETKSQFMMVLL